MSPQRSPGTVDARSLRFDQTVMAVAILCGFVFEAPWVTPLFAALEAATAVQGDQGPLPRLWHTLLSSQLRPTASTREAAGPWRTAAALAAVLLSVGTLVLLVGDVGFSWLFSLAAAGLGALAGVGGICVGCQLHSRRGGGEPEQRRLF
ncbi:MAG: DUF4395 family protein [Acidimicrobiia bacterium]